MTTPVDPLDFADRCVAAGVEALNANRDAGGAIALALLGLTKAVTAIARRHDAMCREIADTLTSASRPGTDP